MTLQSETLKVTIDENGNLKTDATGLAGDEAEIMALLEALAGEVVTGDPAQAVKVEKHTHKHAHGRIHSHGGLKAGHSH